MKTDENVLLENRAHKLYFSCYDRCKGSSSMQLNLQRAATSLQVAAFIIEFCDLNKLFYGIFKISSEFSQLVNIPIYALITQNDNKVMMVAAPSEGRLDEVISSNITGCDKTNHQQKRRACENLRSRLRRIPILVDIFVVVVVGLLVSLVEFGIVPNTKLGFTCKDPKISYPFRGDTVSVTNLLLSAYFGPILIITLVEFLKERSFKKVCVGTVWHYYRECLIGATFVLLITEIIKVIVGEPRPHFLDSCEPDSSQGCKEGTFIIDYNCTNSRLSNFFKADITRSFPSGHTSVSLFIALYCSYLIQIRIPSSVVSTLTKPFLIAVCLTWSLLCSLSRITDRRHHWWDVLGGAFLGICGALYTLCLLHNKEKSNRLSRTSTTMTILSSDSKIKDPTSVVI